MIRERQALIRRVYIFWDLAANSLALYFAYMIKTNFLPLNVRGLRVTDEIFMTLVLIPFLYYFWGQEMKMFDSVRFKSIWQIFMNSAKTMGLVIISILVFFFVMKFQSVSRILIFLYGGIATIMITGNKILLQNIIHFLRKNGYSKRNVLIVGSGKKAQEFLETIHQQEVMGIRVVGLIDKDPTTIGQYRHGYEILGTDEDLHEILQVYPIDEVVCAVPFKKMDNIQKVIDVCEEVGVTVRLISNFFRMLIAQTSVEHLNGLPMLTFSSTPNNLLPLLFKRGLDIVVASIALCLFAPFFLIISLLIKLTSEGPVFFIQERCGLNGRRFPMLKFRTMVQDAEVLKANLAGMNEVSGPVFKMKNDPRVTWIGKWLRKSSLDEFPQFLNVLKGEMSVVGPRPPVPSEVKNYESWQRRRLSMRPGITCVWQISGRSNIGFDEWMRLDLKYIDTWSFWLDLKIIAKTIPIVLLCKGAY